MTTVEEIRQIADSKYFATRRWLLIKAAEEIEALQKERDDLRKEAPTADAIIWRNACNEARDELDDLRRQNAALASALRKVVSWYDSKDSIDVLIDIEKEVKEALAAEGGAK